MRRGRSGAEDGIVDTCSELYVFVSLVFRSGAKFSEDARLAEADANALSRLRSDIMAWLSFFRQNGDYALAVRGRGLRC